MRVMIGCEESQEVCKAFRAKGHEAYSCDILPCSGGHPEWHIKGDILRVIETPRLIVTQDYRRIGIDKWDLMIAHPVCTYLCNSGVRWLYNPDKTINKERWNQLIKAATFFKRLQNSDIPKIAIENPIMHKHAIKLINGKKPDQIIQPYQFGHGETKATCLWLKGLPKLKPTNIVEGRETRIHKMAPSKDRSRLRSITYPGIAKAMAEQWGK